MIRTVIQIDEEKCNGCGICADACHEGAIKVIGGKAKLVRDDFCDGFGDCLPSCPQDAISFVEREAAAYDEAAVERSKRQKAAAVGAHHAAGQCPGSAIRNFERPAVSVESAAAAIEAAQAPSQLSNWPVQIKLAPTQAPYFQDANLLIAADCCAFSCGNFHADFIRNRVCLIGCPKLREADRDHREQRHQERHHHAHGGPVLRWFGAHGERGPARIGEVHSLAGRHVLARRPHLGLASMAGNEAG